MVKELDDDSISSGLQRHFLASAMALQYAIACDAILIDGMPWLRVALLTCRKRNNQIMPDVQ